MMEVCRSSYEIVQMVHDAQKSGLTTLQEFLGFLAGVDYCTKPGYRGCKEFEPVDGGGATDE